MSTPLTSYLQTLHHSLFHSATRHPFLRAAGTGTLPPRILSAWLSQDRLYAQSYIRFIGSLLAKLRLPSHNPDPAKSSRATAEGRAVDVLIDALVNIRRELKFFRDVATEYKFDLEALPVDIEAEDVGAKMFGPNPITHAYIDLFMSASSPATTVLEGIVVLWATEICYLRAWQYALSLSSSASSPPENDQDGGALRKHFIPNWTDPEFEAFVHKIGDVVDEMAGLVKGSESREDVLARCAFWWRQVLWLEERFWPVVEQA